MFLKKLKLVFLLSLLAQAFAFAISDYSDFLIVPSTEILGDKAFQIRGTAGYHRSLCAGEELNMCDRHPFVSSVRFGLFNSLEIGVQFGSNISLDVKNRINRAYSFVPAIALGARAFVQSPEAYFYSVSKSEQKEQTGEFYAAVEWGNDLWKVLGGISAFPAMDADAVAPFWGFEQTLGTPKFSLIYEGFFRHGFSHHNAGFSIKPAKSLQISFGASEFYRYFFNEDSDFGFRTKNQGAANGYRSPGIYLSLAINGGFGSGMQNQKDDVDSLKKEVAAQNADIVKLRERLDTLEMFYYEADPNTGSYNQNLHKKFMEIVNGYKSDEISLDSLRVKEQVFMDRGKAARKFIIETAENKNFPTENRIMAVRMMSHFPEMSFLESLGNIITENSDEAVSREAVFALGVINTPDSRRVLSTVANKTSGKLREIIIEIIGVL